MDEPDPDVRRRFVQGDLDAFETIYRHFEQDVFHWALRVVRDRSVAEDVVIEAFWRAYRSRARFDSTRSLGAWLRRIATNAALNQLRAARTRGTAVDLDEQRTATVPRVDPGVRRAVATAFRDLPPKLRLVAMLALVEQRPHFEIAEAVGVPVGTVKSRIFRAVRQLRDTLTQLGVTP